MADEVLLRRIKGAVTFGKTEKDLYAFGEENDASSSNLHSLMATPLSKQKYPRFSLLFQAEKLKAQEIGRDVVFSADLWYNWMGDENG